jgi:hypothetical protein
MLLVILFLHELQTACFSIVFGIRTCFKKVMEKILKELGKMIPMSKLGWASVVLGLFLLLSQWKSTFSISLIWVALGLVSFGVILIECLRDSD